MEWTATSWVDLIIINKMQIGKAKGSSLSGRTFYLKPHCTLKKSKALYSIIAVAPAIVHNYKKVSARKRILFDCAKAHALAI